MAIRAEVSAEVSAAARERLTGLGLTLVEEPVESPWRVTGPAVGTYRYDAGPVVLQVIPASAAPLRGPVALLSPTGADTGLEAHVAASLAAAAGRRVIHLNACGRSASFEGDEPARAAARAATAGWRELPTAHPLRALHTLDSRPAMIVTPAVPGIDGPSGLLAAHPDADVVVVHELITASYGPELAAQFVAMVELTLGMQTGSAAAAPRPVRESAASSFRAPSFRASDVFHVRLTESAAEVTNRTRHPIRVRLGLGDRRAPAQVLATWQSLVRPGASAEVGLDDAPALAGIARPAAELRHFSHDSAEVFEGGDLRVLRIELAVAGTDDEAQPDGAPREFPAGNGLDFSLTARELQRLADPASVPAVLPDYAPPPAPPPGQRDPLGALTTALGVAAGAVSSVRSEPGS